MTQTYIGIESPRAGRRYAVWAGAVVGAVLFCALCSALTFWLMALRVVQFDMKGTVDLFNQQAAQQQTDSASLQQLSAKFGESMAAALTQYQQANHAVILVSPAVIGGAQDITVQIRSDISRRMQGAK